MKTSSTRPILLFLPLFLSLMILAATDSRAQFNEDLVAYWPFNGDLDDAVNDHHGTNLGFAPIVFTDEAKFGQGVDLDGIDQYIEPAGAESDFDFTGGSITISAWFRVSFFGPSWQCLVAKGEGNNWRVHRRGDASSMTYAGGAGEGPDNGIAVNDDEIHHIVAVTRHAEQSEVWLDGVLVETASSPSIGNNDVPMLIGENPDARNRFWAGLIDDLAIWGRALSPEEIAIIWNNGDGTELMNLLQDVDADNDGILDWWEESNGLDPGDPGDASEDPDEDGLTNLEEFEGRTNPRNPDTDGDGLADGVETGTGTWVSEDDRGTSPTKADSDGDGLRDGVETNTNDFVNADNTGTDPNKVDSDGDDFQDGTEVSAGTDPTDPTSFPSVPIFLGIGTQALLGGDLTDPENDGDPESDFGYNAVFDSSEEQGFGGGESAYNVFDNIVGGGNDKWCCGDGGLFPDEPIWIDATFPEAIVLTHFTISSANDTPGRDPLVWEIQGSNDRENYTTIYRHDDRVASIWGPDRLSVMRFNAGVHYPTPAAYTTIRYQCEATGLASGARFQLGELEYFGEPGSVEAFRITSVSVSGPRDEITLTWTSRPGATYSVFGSADLAEFALEIDDSVDSGGESTTFTFANPIPDAERVYFIVRENEIP